MFFILVPDIFYKYKKCGTTLAVITHLISEETLTKFTKREIFVRFSL